MKPSRTRSIVFIVAGVVFIAIDIFPTVVFPRVRGHWVYSAIGACLLVLGIVGLMAGD